jgi:tRNA nucleotidyltransferase/poly(A) polymerase
MAKATSHAEKLENVQAVLRRLRDAGHEAWLNGGCVRDHLLGKEPADFDVATSAKPDQVEAIFPGSIPVGKAFGVIRVRRRSDWFEVATFRKDGVYVDGRHPASVSFSTAAEDAARRDFTINGMFWDPASGEILDFVGGREDLRRRVVRAIGDADARLSEDSLRILRAVRFGAQEGFTLDPGTQAAVIRHRDRLRQVAPERIREEFLKLASGSPGTREQGVRLLAACRLVEVLFPETTAEDVAAGAAVARATPSATLPLFLSAVLGRAAPASARPPRWRELAATVSARLRLSNDEAKALSDLLALRVRARGAPRAPAARRRLLAALPRFEHLRELLAAEGGAEDALRILDEVRARHGPELPPPLLDGDDLLRLGVPPRKAVGRWLRRITILGLSGKASTKDEAAAWVRARLARGLS